MLVVWIVVVAVVVLTATSYTVLRRRGRAAPDGDIELRVDAGIAAAKAEPAPRPVAPPAPEPVPAPPAPEPERAEAPSPPRLGERLGRARELLAAPLGAIRGRASVDDETFRELETVLLLANVGQATTKDLLDRLHAQVREGTVPPDPNKVLAVLRDEIVSMFASRQRTLEFAPSGVTVWLMVGVNGVGKTTTIGKIAASQASAGRAVVLAAGDTFRAAAVEQLATWAERSDASLISGSDGADPSSVVYNAIQHAQARSADLVVADTAGRLHTKVNLMEELKKIRRVADRPPGVVTEVLLVIDATTGQNGLVQAQEFTAATGVTGIVLTKLDGTAKGGIALAIEHELEVPIKLVGIGEGATDLVVFDPGEFAAALVD